MKCVYLSHSIKDKKKENSKQSLHQANVSTCIVVMNMVDIQQKKSTQRLIKSIENLHWKLGNLAVGIVSSSFFLSTIEWHHHCCVVSLQSADWIGIISLSMCRQQRSQHLRERPLISWVWDLWKRCAILHSDMNSLCSLQSPCIFRVRIEYVSLQHLYRANASLGRVNVSPSPMRN